MSSLKDKSVSATESSAPPAAVVAVVGRAGALLDFVVEGPRLDEDVCVGGTSGDEVTGGGGGGGTSFAVAAPAAAAPTPSPPVGTTNMGANKGICVHPNSTSY
nr:hypothetical protein [Tanacetum cinerariifolium]